MKSIRNFFALFIATLLIACSSIPEGARPVSAEYCDNFLIYDMCARDLSRNGVVDLVYFTDTLEVFMFRPGAEENIPDDLGVHRCVRPMDDELVATTSRLFYIDEETTYLERQDIRGAMLLKYMAYMPEVTACNLRHDRAEETDNTAETL
ncbi:MAG: hypothetical protein RL839_16720 [Gammaproteobacteria bacterium]